MKKIVFLILGVMMFFSCKGKSSQDVQGSWITSKVVVDGSQIQIFNSTLEISQTEKNIYKVSGNAGINRFSGEMQIEKGKITSEKERFLKTLMAGEEHLQEFENLFLSLITDAQKIELKDGILIFKNPASKSEIHFMPDITGSWKISSLFKGSVAQEIVVSDLEIKFTEQPCVFSFSGTSGVNRFFGNVSFKDGKIYSPENGFATTRMLGSPEAMAFEELFIDILSNADKFSLKDNLLSFEKSIDKSVLTFSK